MAGIELGCPYYFSNPSGLAKFSLNSITDPDFVGYVTEITGLDMAGVRENAEVITAGDGGHHGSFWMDRRPFTFSGIIIPAFPLVARDAAQEKIQGCLASCRASDGKVIWTPADGITRQVPFRVQQPARITTGQSNAQKNFQIAAVAADWRISASQQSLVSIPLTTCTASGTNSWSVQLPTATNVGNADAPLILNVTFRAPTNQQATVALNNTSTSQSLVWWPVWGWSGPWQLDFTGAYPTLTNQADGTNGYGLIDPVQSDFGISVGGTATVANGINNFTITVTTGSTPWQGAAPQIAATLYWNHSWA